jgi:hypothetical protein
VYVAVVRRLDGAGDTVALCPSVVITAGVMVDAEPEASTVTHTTWLGSTVTPAWGRARAGRMSVDATAICRTVRMAFMSLSFAGLQQQVGDQEGTSN